MTEPSNHESLKERDALTLRVLGLFFVVLGSLVTIGSFWSLGNPPALVVNLCAGFVLLAAGAGGWWTAARIVKR